MHTYLLHREQMVPKPLASVFDFFAKAENLGAITPPWMRFSFASPPPAKMKRGVIIRYALRVHGFPISWVTEIERWDPPFEFVDVQKKGPYRLWRHKHTFSEASGGTRVVDDVHYALPLGILGRVVHALQVRKDVQQIFDYREQQIRERFG